MVLALLSARGASLTTILTNGPPANRLNVVFLSEGYTSAQLNQFYTDATNALNVLLADEPFASYRRHVNGFAIAVASAQSGSDHPNSGRYVSTYFNSAYFGACDCIIMIPPHPLDANYANGQGKVDALLTQFLPQADLAVLLVNDLTPGGSGGQTVITAPIQVEPYILSHETGHSLAGLGDEYEYEQPGYPEVEEPNTTRETNRALVKWRAWIAPQTPVPTPATAEYWDAVGLFEGAHYHATGWYRPKQECRMRSYAAPFCEVCREALVRSLYRHARPIESFGPTNATLTLTTTQAQHFSLGLLQPLNHGLAVQWFTNGVPVPDATNSALSLWPRALGNGTHTVRAVVRDPTPFVRSDPANDLWQTQTWTVTVSLPWLELDAPRWLPGNRFAVRVTGLAPQGFVIQTSTNLSNWVSLTTNTLGSGPFEYTNVVPAGVRHRFYRARTPP